MTSVPNDDEEFGEARAARLVERILTERFEQGCWLPIAAARQFCVSDEQAEDLETAWSRIGDEAALEKLEALEAKTVPGLDQDLAPEEPEDRYLITTQQCDLIREPAVEPTIEVVRSRWETDPNNIGARRNLKSWREIVVAERPSAGALIANSRRRLLLDKRALLDLPARQALEDTGSARRRFAYWAGARYTRRPVPHDLAVRVERPLREAMRTSSALKALANEFVMFVLVVEADGLRLFAIYENENDADRLERSLAALCEQVPFQGLSAEECEVRHVAQAPMTWAIGVDAYPLELESYSGPGDPTSPALAG